jgi:predicted regulator of Ras-like GTPase activity (Roadblock/LC7/MglB family)
MSANILSTLGALRDVDGVVGSFVVDGDGALLARDLPQIFESELLHEIGPRIRRIADGLSESGDTPGSVVLHFQDHKLWLKPADGFTLCVLGSVQVNRPALRMALTLVARRVTPLVGGVAGPGLTTPMPPSLRAPDTLISSAFQEAADTPYPPTTVSPNSTTIKRPAMYRGRLIDE